MGGVDTGPGHGGPDKPASRPKSVDGRMPPRIAVTPKPFPDNESWNDQRTLPGSIQNGSMDISYKHTSFFLHNLHLESTRTPP